MRERLEELRLDPLEECIRIAQSDESSNELKAKIWLGILDHVSPKLRAVDQTIGAADGTVAKIEIVRVSAKPEPEDTISREIPTDLPHPRWPA